MKLLYVSLLVIGWNHLFAHAMHGGELYKIEKVPYLAQINHFQRRVASFCGAAILSERWMLTASHCIKDGNEKLLFSTALRVGSSKTLAEGKLYNISRTVKREKYSIKSRWNSDICLIELAESIEFNDKSRPISISKAAPRVQSEITIAGYGDDYDKLGYNLKVGHQTIITRKDCRQAYKNAPQGKIILDERTFCTDSTVIDLGRGDSGSPAVLNGKVVGIAVEGSEAPLPNIYVNVAHYYDWIVDTTGIKFD